MVRLQASTDFDCPQSDIRIDKEWGGRFSARGCGQKATYNTGCDDGIHCIVQPEGKAVPWRDRPEPAPGTNRPHPIASRLPVTSYTSACTPRGSASTADSATGAPSRRPSSRGAARAGGPAPGPSSPASTCSGEELVERHEKVPSPERIGVRRGGLVPEGERSRAFAEEAGDLGEQLGVQAASTGGAARARRGPRAARRRRARAGHGLRARSEPVRRGEPASRSISPRGPPPRRGD